jgi:hypothetical protein
MKTYGGKEQTTPERTAKPHETAGTAFTSNRASTATIRGFQKLADNSPGAVQLKQQAELIAAGTVSTRMRHFQEIAGNPLQTAQRKPQAESTAARAAAPGAAPVHGGLPDQLKSGIESLSGMRMDHVKVHYNSDKPKQLQAHAYAQGSEIHLASGQERHLAHEAWHVVQQAQGRVKATTQRKGAVALNDDAGLEAEADAMAAKLHAPAPVPHGSVQPGKSTYGAVAQCVTSVSAFKFIPAAADLVFINALDGQIAQAEIDASNDVQNNPAPALHSVHQTAYMNQPSARAWGNCVEEKLNVWALANGWSTQNNSGGSNPDYSRMNGGTKIWADLTTAAEAGAGASHIIDKLDRKVASDEDPTGWVAADVVHNSLDPLNGGPPVAPIPNGAVSLAHRIAWQAYKSYKNVEGPYDDLMALRTQMAGPLPGYATYTQMWNQAQRDTFADWINGNNDANLQQDESEDESSEDEDDFDDSSDDSDDGRFRKKRKMHHHTASDDEDEAALVE